MKPLTKRELACLHWAAVGKTSWEMGMILGITERTINFHIHNACQKLAVHSRQAAITAALQAGLLDTLTRPPLSNAGSHRPAAAEKNQHQPSPRHRSMHGTAPKL